MRRLARPLLRTTGTAISAGLARPEGRDMPGIRQFHHRTRPMAPARDGVSLLTGGGMMVAVGLLLYWIPVVNGIVAGLLGGYRIGGTIRALAATLLPALLVAAGMWALVTVLDLPVVTAFADTSIWMFVGYSVLALFAGAGIGGAIARERP